MDTAGYEREIAELNDRLATCRQFHIRITREWELQKARANVLSSDNDRLQAAFDDCGTRMGILIAALARIANSEGDEARIASDALKHARVLADRSKT